MERLTRYKSLVRVYLCTLFDNFSGGLNIRRRTNNAVGKFGSNKTINGILAVVGVLFILALLIASVTSITVIAAQEGFIREMAYTLVGMCQLTILILGGNVVLSYLYFSNDLDLILSLPIAPGEAFAAKFTVSYISQLVISVFFVPVFLTFGITASMNGVDISPSFYILAVLSAVLLPAFPLVLMGLFSAPIMFILRFFKNKELVKTVFTIISSFLGMALYFAMFFSVGTFNGEDDVTMGANMIPIISNTAKFCIYNYNFCEALLGNNAFINALLFVLECVGSIGLAIILCGFFYRRIMFNMLDKGSGKKKKVKGEIIYKSISYKKTLFFKDLKIIFKSPVLLFSTALGLVMCPIFTVIFHNMFGNIGDNTSVYGSELSSLGMIYYFNSIMLISSNMATSVFISLEKGNIATLKSLPISGKDIVFSKIKVSAILIGSNCLTFLIAYLCLTQFVLQPFIGIALAVIIFMQGIGFSIWELMRDMEAPNFRFNNVNELTKNNKRIIKPMFLSMGAGIMGMAAAIALGSALPEEFIYLGYIVFFVLIATVASLFFFIPLNKMKKNVETLYQNLEV